MVAPSQASCVRWPRVAERIEADVRLHGEHVGILSYDRGGSSFIYEDDLNAVGHRVLGQIFEDAPGARRRELVGLPAWFANLLPEGELRKQIIREMGGGHIRDFTLLMRLGTDLPGAVTVHGAIEPSDESSHAEASESAPGADQPIRHSLAGVQLKFSIHGDHLTFPAEGKGSWWIAKLPDRSLKDLSLNEYLTMRWLRDANVTVPHVQLVPASSVDVISAGLVDPDELIYLIERYDRTPSGRVHVEDFAQVADIAPKFKYDSGVTYDSMAAAVLSMMGHAGYSEYIRRLTAMIVVGNIDAHLKNWSVIYSDGRTPALSPVYDFHSLTVYSKYQYQPLALSLDGESLASSIYPDNIRRLAERCECDPERTAEVVRSTVSEMREAWTGELKSEADLRFPALSRHFQRRLESLPICLE
jgi:serine/threonine-protein kinase HipA